MIAMVICHYDETNSRGGLEKQARMLSQELRAAGENVVVLGSTRKWSRAGWSDDQGVPVRLFWSYQSPQVSGRYLPASLIWVFQLFIWIAMHRREIAILHGHQIRIHAFALALARKLFGIPTILKSAVGGSGADIRVIGTRKYFGAPGRRFVIKGTDVFIAITGSIREDLMHWNVPSEKVIVIPNGIQLGTPPSPAPPEIRARRALFLGRLAADKNTPALARAALAAAANMNLQVDFYGRGKDLEQLQRIVAAGNTSKVAYQGFVEEPAKILGQYGWLLLPSDAEGLSNAMIEAMAYGVVPITTKVSGCIDHIVPNETGLFFDSVEICELEARLRETCTIRVDEWQAMSSRAENRARQLFDMKSVVRAYQNLYAQLQQLSLAAR